MLTSISTRSSCRTRVRVRPLTSSQRLWWMNGSHEPPHIHTKKKRAKHIHEIILEENSFLAIVKDAAPPPFRKQKKNKNNYCSDRDDSFDYFTEYFFFFYKILSLFFFENGARRLLFERGTRPHFSRCRNLPPIPFFSFLLSKRKCVSNVGNKHRYFIHTLLDVENWNPYRGMLTTCPVYKKTN